jgi:hypothetical protein
VSFVAPACGTVEISADKLVADSLETAGPAPYTIDVGEQPSEKLA